MFFVVAVVIVVGGGDGGGGSGTFTNQNKNSQRKQPVLGSKRLAVTVPGPLVLEWSRAHR